MTSAIPPANFPAARASESSDWPGGAMPDSACVKAPGSKPLVSDLLDYRGVVTAASRLGFDYDDVPA